MHGISVQFSVSFGYPFEGYDGEKDADEPKSHEHTLDTNICIHEAGQLKSKEILEFGQFLIVTFEFSSKLDHQNCL